MRGPPAGASAVSSAANANGSVGVGVGADSDGDGIPDSRDRCPRRREDRDGFEDSDGCPDPDNDGDKIADLEDQCAGTDRDRQNGFARVAEDHDGYLDKDGCPDPDNDRDRICDNNARIQAHRKHFRTKCKGSDHCPDRPETVNGVKDDDGCPDIGPVRVTRLVTVLVDRIYFEAGKSTLKRVSYPILDAVAATMKAQPQIRLLEIRGHADDPGTAAANRALSLRRARAVYHYLWPRVPRRPGWP